MSKADASNAERAAEHRHLLAIDPGPTESAYLFLYDGKPSGFGMVPNQELLEMLGCYGDHCLAIEGIESQGMAVGKDVFATCIWIGRFWQRFGEYSTTLVYRSQVKMHLCGSMRAKDPNIRQALIDRYGPSKELAIGRKAATGPLYGISGHVWSALAVAVTYWDQSEAVLKKHGA